MHLSHNLRHDGLCAAHRCRCQQRVSEVYERSEVSSATHVALQKRRELRDGVVILGDVVCDGVSLAPVGVRERDDSCHERMAHGRAHTVEYHAGGHIIAAFVVYKEVGLTTKQCWQGYWVVYASVLPARL